MKLLEEQIQELKQKKEELMGKRQMLTEISKDKAQQHVIGNDEQKPQNTAELYEELHQLSKEIDKIDKLLNKSTVIEKSSSDKIKIGSSFKIKFSDEDSIFELTLVEDNYASNDYYISSLSPLGKNLIGKKEGEAFSYHVDVSNLDINGVVVEIEKQNAPTKSKNKR